MNFKITLLTIFKKMKDKIQNFGRAPKVIFLEKALI